MECGSQAAALTTAP